MREMTLQSQSEGKRRNKREDVQTPLVKERGRYGQYILLKSSYVTRSLRPLHSWVFFIDRESRLREEPEAGLMSASRSLDSCKYKCISACTVYQKGGADGLHS